MKLLDFGQNFLRILFKNKLIITPKKWMVRVGQNYSLVRDIDIVPSMRFLHTWCPNPLKI